MSENRDHHGGLLAWFDRRNTSASAADDDACDQSGRVSVFTGTAAAPPAQTARVTAAPAPFPSEHEQAAHELDLAIALVLNAPQAGRSLHLLVNSDQIHPEGALVFACLLAVADREDAAQFWWQFAAGSGSPTAAYLLHLDHQRHGETRDAAYWRAQAEQLAANPRRPTRSYRSTTALLPDDVRHDILARCHEGLHPRLPAPLEGVINRLTVAADDEDFGEIPQPSKTIVGDLVSMR